ncbi:MAG: glutathione synthase [Silicimonas sp.]|nr:glutathione synthase [Silicimonas sp.]
MDRDASRFSGTSRYSRPASRPIAALRNPAACATYLPRQTGGQEGETPAVKVAIQMDPIGPIDINADSTFRIAEEAQALGHDLFYYTPDRLAWQQGRVTARGWPLTVRREVGNHFSLGDETEVDLAEFDVVWLRQDPPFDMGYITTTHLLELVTPKTLVVNDPFWVRNYPEKLLVLQFPDLTPPTTIARDLETLRAFRRDHGDMILKPLYGNGGAGVFRLTSADRNLVSLHEMFTGINREPLIAQKFVPDVSNGDKRIILVDGDPVGAINRVPADGETRSNLHVGGTAERVGLTDRDREICAAIGPLLKKKGQIFVGIDVIGKYLTEINVTSPTGIQELERFDETNVAGKIWEAIEARRAA